MLLSCFRYAGGAAALVAITSTALAAGTPATPASTIRAVTLYPGVASVERVLHLPAGSTQAVFACLPAQLDPRSLQVRSDRSVRIGEVNVQTLERRIATGCDSAVAERIRSAQDDVARAQAEVQGLELAHTWLTTQAGAAPGTQGLPPPPQIGAKAQALRRSAVDTLTQLARAQRTLEERQQALERIQAEQGSVQSEQVAMVRVTLASANAADIHLHYQVRGPSWGPSYRARLNTETATVELERLALVAQTTGEDWRGVALTLSTGQPLAASQGPLPRPWTLDVPPPPTAQAEMSMASAPMVALSAPAPAPALRKTASADAAPLPSFEAVSTEGSYATQFALPQKVSIPSGGERVTLSLSAEQVPAVLVARTTPMREPHAWLVAQLPKLSGDWPAGPMALERDQANVGQTRFDPQSSDFERLGLSFGRDDRIVVRTEPVKELTDTAGFMQGRSERSIEHRFSVENRHRQPIVLQVLEAAPVAKNAAIRVQTSFSPNATSTEWNGQPGFVLWEQELEAQVRKAFSAKYTISTEKGTQVHEQR